MILTNRRVIRLLYRDIILIESDDNYIRVYTTESKVPHLIRFTIKQAEQMLPGRLFFRVHRSYIICLYHLKHFTKDTVDMGLREVPLGIKYAQALHERFLVWGVFWGKGK